MVEMIFCFLVVALAIFQLADFVTFVISKIHTTKRGKKSVRLLTVQIVFELLVSAILIIIMNIENFAELSEVSEIQLILSDKILIFFIISWLLNAAMDISARKRTEKEELLSKQES